MCVIYRVIIKLVSKNIKVTHTHTQNILVDIFIAGLFIDSLILGKEREKKVTAYKTLHH